MITVEHRQEQLSRAYVHAVAAHAGLVFEPATQDYGVDGTVRVVKENNGRRFTAGHSLDIQLKATTCWSVRDDSIIYDVEAKTYNDLVTRFTEPRGTPMVLVVLCLPQNEIEWLAVSSDQMILRHCCYWCRVAGLRTPNISTQRIEIPKKNLLDRTSLADLLRMVEKGEVLP